MTVMEAGWLAGFGIAIGLAGSVGAATLMRGLLSGVRSWEEPALASAAVVLGSARCSPASFPLAAPHR
jgi:hypothetical protein